MVKDLSITFKKSRMLQGIVSFIFSVYLLNHVNAMNRIWGWPTWEETEVVREEEKAYLFSFIFFFFCSIDCHKTQKQAHRHPSSTLPGRNVFRVQLFSSKDDHVQARTWPVLLSFAAVSSPPDMVHKPSLNETLVFKVKGDRAGQLISLLFPMLKQAYVVLICLDFY